MPHDCYVANLAFTFYVGTLITAVCINLGTTVGISMNNSIEFESRVENLKLLVAKVGVENSRCKTCEHMCQTAVIEN